MLKLGQIVLTSGNKDHIDHITDSFLNLGVSVVDPVGLLDLQLDDSTWIFIDWLLPTMAGVLLLNLLRQTMLGRRAKVTMVLPNHDETLRARALEAGADDYILGPLSPEALAERIRVYQGAVRQPETAVLTIGKMDVDTNAYLARYEGRALTLKTLEFRLLAHFFRNPDRIFTRASLIGVLGKGGEVHAERTVDTWMSRLRRSLQRQGVPLVPRTVRSAGYILDTR
ncbi:response regulator transcription factor [Novosphingobium sp. 1949]|uniref:Response regulator transcription factor n=1 Tax=Novosphingobium organovorum TaxID=2930092 RepID=A0ABT0BG20_9SPHN|nr:response regulator transcription factor [Novosphingobium organovorum]MCJ2183980.1 response regulator transcription factor [Novosphingobium organovorum]